MKRYVIAAITVTMLLLAVIPVFATLETAVPAGRSSSGSGVSSVNGGDGSVLAITGRGRRPTTWFQIDQTTGQLFSQWDAATETGWSILPNTTTGNCIEMDASTLTGGTALLINTAGATMTAGGHYMELTESGLITQFSVGKGGQTVIAASNTTGNALQVESSEGATTSDAALCAFTNTNSAGDQAILTLTQGATTASTKILSLVSGVAEVFSVDIEGDVLIAGTLGLTGNTSLASLDVGGGYTAGTGGSGTTITATGAVSANGAGIFETGLTLGANGATGQTGTFSIKDGANPGITTFSVVGSTGASTIVPDAAVDALTITGTASTSGDAIAISFVDATLSGGKYINALGGAGSTEVFSVGEDGATAITSTAVGTNSLSITNNTTTSGDLIILTADDDSLDNDTFYLNCLGGTAHDTSVLSIGEDGALAIASTQVGTNSVSVTNNATTSGDLVTLTADDDTLDSDTYYISCLGGTDHATAVWSVGEGGQTLITPSAAAIAVDAITIAGTALTSGDFIQMAAADATLNGGKYINALGGTGTTEVFSVAEDGVTAITSTAVASNSLSVTNVNTTSGDLVTLVGDDDTLDSDTYYIACLGGTDHATAVWSVGEGGQTLITPSAAAITADAITVAGNALTSGDFIQLTADDDLLNGGKYLNCIGGAGADTAVFTIGEGGAVVNTGTIDTTIANTVAGGDKGINLNMNQGAVALTGTLHGMFIRATNGSENASGTIRGIEAGARNTDDGGTAAVLTGGYFSADPKNKEGTTLRAIEAVLAGSDGGTSTLAVGVEVFNNTAAIQSTSVAYDVNEGSAAGRTAFTYDLRMQNGESITNSTDGTIQATTSIIKHALDADDYWTVTQANNGGATFDSTSAGTAGFAFSDKVDITGVLGVKYGANDYTTVTQADAGSCTVDITTDGTANFILSDMMTLGADGTGVDLQLYTDLAGSNLLWDASDNTLEGTGSTFIAIGDTTTGVVTAGGGQMIYGQGIQKTAALTGDLIGVRGNSRVSIDSPSGKAIGGYFLAGNGAGDDIGYELDIMRGVYTGVVSKAPADATATINTARGYEVSMDLDQGTLGHTVTITDAQMFYGVYNAPTSGAYATITNGYGVYLKNEAVGGTGQALDAALYVDDASMSGGIKGWDYGIDLSGVADGFTTADIKLGKGALISNNTSGEITLTGTLTAPQQTVVAETTNARVCTSADFGKMIVLSCADAIAVTLPANASTAGSYIDFLITVENGGTVTISPAVADTLYTAGSDNSDAVTFATGHRIGAYCRAVSNGANWTVVNLSQVTMGVTDTD